MKSWLPWQFLLRVAARRRGFVDPIELLARLRRFAQPSEVQEPIELVRAGVLFHARGLINTKVFQYNLDWVWPFWVARQFDPADPSFLPRAFSFSHVNLTHRNWTAVGLPGMEACPIVDPRGMVTLPDDPWSLDWWFVPDEGRALYPSRHAEAEQRLEWGDGLVVATASTSDACRLETSARVEAGTGPGDAHLVLEAHVATTRPGALLLAARPANPEGVHFIEHVAFENAGWTVNGRYRLNLSQAADALIASTYAHGDVSADIASAARAGDHVRWSAGMATAAAVFRLEAGASRTVVARVDLASAGRAGLRQAGAGPLEAWPSALEGTPRVRVPEDRWIFLHDAAVRTIVLLSPGDIFPGPYTYRRFWFRDACLIMNAFLACNLERRVLAAMERFPSRQRADGYFHSQEGEWDANGQVLWIADRLERCTGNRVDEAFWASLRRGAAWITRKRRAAGGKTAHPGLLPPGFSAEHLGPVDQYYWDDLWGIAGLQAAADLAERRGETGEATRWRRERDSFADDVRGSLARLQASVARNGVPASPHRRMDAGAIGSMVADYPLQLDDVISRDQAFRTADWLWRRCRVGGAFFQEMIHSGLNAYLTLALAQTFMRHGDGRHEELVDAVAALASPTGQWPEAVHPRTGGGCMGDGQHAWAAAEWILIVRAMFVREEADGLVVGAGIRRTWLERGEPLSYGPTATAWGSVEVELLPTGETWRVRVSGRWHDKPPAVRVTVPGFVPTTCPPEGECVVVRARD